MTNKKLKFKDISEIANQNGFELENFLGFKLTEVDSGADLYFKNLNDVNNYIKACDLSEHELRQRYNFTTDSEIAE